MNNCPKCGAPIADDDMFCMECGAKQFKQCACGNTLRASSKFCNKCGAKQPMMANGHEYVDLGLPSGTLWATCNVGASKPEEYGDYFAWGETTPKKNYDWSTYKYGTDIAFTKYCNDKNYGKDGYTDTKTVLDAEDDAATANWGSDWRIPTKAEQDELRNDCQWTWTTQNCKKGYRVTGPNSNSIFLPAAGFCSDDYLNYDGSLGDYWSSTLDEDNPYNAYGLGFYSGKFRWYHYDRYYGRSVRPVLKR